MHLWSFTIDLLTTILGYMYKHEKKICLVSSAPGEGIRLSDMAQLIITEPKQVDQQQPRAHHT